ncbi:MAG: hypothetical protein VCF24_28340 [Candidatus Latescibacterota bacterium]
MADSIVVLYRGGRLPSWHQLSPDEQVAFQDEHVDLMLTVGVRHGLQSIEGFRLLAPRGEWERWWTIRFPDLAGAEAWMRAEVAPPYGRYGSYEYQLARPWTPPSLAWLPQRQASKPVADADPRVVPSLSVDRGSIVVIAFGGWERGSDDVEPTRRGDAERSERLQRVAREHSLIHGEVFRLLGTGPDGDLAWVLEFPTLAGAEAWIETEGMPPAEAYQRRAFHLARRWAPDYFATWSC